MSRTYRRKDAKGIHDFNRWDIETENEYNLGGFDHRYFEIENSVPYSEYRKKKLAIFHYLSYKWRGSAPSWYCNYWNRSERYSGRQQIKYQLARREYDDIDVRRICGPMSATYSWW